jgi:hypothetical protein
VPAVAHPVRDHCLAPDRSVDAPIASVGGRYGRAFPALATLEVGGRLVAEVLLGLLDADPESDRALAPQWEPTLPAAGERFGVLDLLVGPP